MLQNRFLSYTEGYQFDLELNKSIIQVIKDLILVRATSKPKGFSIDVTKRLIESYHLDTYEDLDDHASLVLKDKL